MTDIQNHDKHPVQDQTLAERSATSGSDVLEAGHVSRIIEMAWEDRTPFEAIATQYGLSEPEVIRLMRKNMKASSFRMWRQRVSGRKTKHMNKRGFKVGRFVCPTQRLR